jgi:mono/diheme cytochrome c family protein
VLLAITSEGKLGLGVLAGAFIVFALLSAFYFPRRNPEFPGNRLGLYIAVAALFFLGTMAGVIFFAREEEEAHGAEAAETHGTETGEEPATTEAPGTPAGDATAGEAVFASAGCGGCHTLEAAGSSGKVGPNLDDAKPDAALVIERVTNGMGVMPSFKGDLSEQQIQDVAAYVSGATQG